MAFIAFIARFAFIVLGAMATGKRVVLKAGNPCQNAMLEPPSYESKLKPNIVSVPNTRRHRDDTRDGELLSLLTCVAGQAKGRRRTRVNAASMRVG
jgi:hypothetical protein